MMLSEKTLIKTIAWLAYAVLAVPLLFSVYFTPSHIAPQTFTMRLLVEMMLFAYIALTLSNSAYIPKFSALSWSVIAFAGIYIVAGIFGLNPAQSFFSDLDWHWGFLTVAHLLAFFFILSGVVRGREAWRRLFAVSVSASALSALYGVWQFFFTPEIGRIYSTIGNPAALSSYVLLNAVIAAWLAFESVSLKEKIFFGGIALLDISVTVMTGTRATALALIAALGVFLVGYLLFRKKESRKGKFVLSGGIIVLVITLALVYGFRDSAFVKNNATLSRLTNISASAGTSKTRLYAWQAAWESFKEYPVLGVGPENFSIAFNRHFDPGFYTYEKNETEFMRAHNIFLEMLATAGIAGLGTYLAVFISFLALIVRGVRQKVFDSHFGIMGFAFVAAYFVQGFFNMDTLTTFLPLLLLVAFADAGMAKTGEKSAKQAKKPELLPLTLVAVALLYAGWSLTIKPAFADRALSDATALSQRMQELTPADAVSQAVPLYKEALVDAPYGTDTIRTSLAQFTLDFYSQFGDAPGSGFQKQLLPYALSESLAEAKENTYDYFSAYYAARLDVIGYALARKEDAAVAPLVESLMMAMPTRLELLFVQAQYALMRQDFDRAITLATQGVKASPAFADFYHILFLAYNFKNNQESAFQSAENAIANGFTFTNIRELLWLAHTYKQKGITDKAQDFYERARTIDQNIPPLQ